MILSFVYLDKVYLDYIKICSVRIFHSKNLFLGFSFLQCKLDMIVNGYTELSEKCSHVS